MLAVTPKPAEPAPRPDLSDYRLLLSEGERASRGVGRWTDLFNEVLGGLLEQ